jgi:hypothetical protein
MAEPPDLPPFLQDALAKSRELSGSVQQWRERNGRQLERANEMVRDYQRRFGGWIERNGPQIEAVLKALVQFNQEGDRVAREWKDAGLAYLVTPLNLAERLMISMHTGPGNEEELLDFLEATLADQAFVGSVTELLDEATMLSDVARAHLKHGFAHLSDRESFEAWPPLIIGLEGAFADVAVEYGMAVRKGNDIFLTDKKSGRPLGSPSVEKVAVELGHSAEATEFGEFLIRQVYGGAGNPFRHGTAREGVHQHTLSLAVAVIGWLDAFVSPGCRMLLRDAFVREAARRQGVEPGEFDEPDGVVDPTLG